MYRGTEASIRCGTTFATQRTRLLPRSYDELIGLDAKTVGGHSLRAGFLTSGAARGASIFKMMDVSRHRSVDTLRDYVRDAENEVVTPKRLISLDN